MEGFAGQVAADVSAQAARRVLAEALRKLPAADRDVLLLVAWGGLTYEEVAATLDIKVGTVRSRWTSGAAQWREASSYLDRARWSASRSARPRGWPTAPPASASEAVWQSVRRELTDTVVAELLPRGRSASGFKDSPTFAHGRSPILGGLVPQPTEGQP